MTTPEAEAPKASGAQGIFAKSPMIFSIDSKNETLFSKFVAIQYSCLLVGWLDGIYVLQWRMMVFQFIYVRCCNGLYIGVVFNYNC